MRGHPRSQKPPGNDTRGQAPSQPLPNSLRPHCASPLPGAHVQAPPLLSDPSLSEIPSRPAFAQNLKNTKAGRLQTRSPSSHNHTDRLLQRGSRSRTHTEPSGRRAPARGLPAPAQSVPAQPHSWLSQTLGLAVPRKRDTAGPRAARGPGTRTSVRKMHSQPSGFSPAETTSFGSEPFPELGTPHVHRADFGSRRLSAV